MKSREIVFDGLVCKSITTLHVHLSIPVWFLCSRLPPETQLQVVSVLLCPTHCSQQVKSEISTGRVPKIPRVHLPEFRDFYRKPIEEERKYPGGGPKLPGTDGAPRSATAEPLLGAPEVHLHPPAQHRWGGPNCARGRLIGGRGRRMGGEEWK